MNRTALEILLSLAGAIIHFLWIPIGIYLLGVSVQMSCCDYQPKVPSYAVAMCGFALIEAGWIGTRRRIGE